MRLIDADALFKAIKSDKIAWRFGVPNTLKIMFDYIKIIINEQPTVDAVPVVHGRWVDTGDSYEDERCRYNYWGCSACGNRIAGRYGLHNYCPDCGAKMDLDGVEL